MPSLLEVSAHLIAALPAVGVLPTSRVDRQVLRQAHCGEHLFLLRDFSGVKWTGLLHGGQSHQHKAGGFG